ncbi:shikimate dehydrogenase [candidate division KSB1 bacterium]|nr:shikimate dehydrogenase [candidate division KSB1 bacterium]
MKIFYVIGDPIDHSLSPLLHRFFLERFNIAGEYQAKRVPVDELNSAIDFFIQNNTSGINITTPLKEKIIPFTDELTTEAETIGSVNTIKFFDGKIIGHNTDAIGFQQSLLKSGYVLKDKQAIIFGAGGAARAIAVGLIRAQCQKISIINRNFEKAIRLANWVTNRFPNASVEALRNEAHIVEAALQKCHLLLNATTIGMGKMSDQSVLASAELLHDNMLVYDLIYRPYRTKLIRQAEQENIPWQNGMDMLIYQGFESLKFWIDRELTLDHTLYVELRNMLRREVCRE